MRAAVAVIGGSGFYSLLVDPVEHLTLTYDVPNRATRRSGMPNTCSNLR